MSHYQALLNRLKDIVALNESAAIVSYDQQTQMPSGGAEGRARHLGVLSRLSHEFFTAEETGRLLEASRQEVGDDYASDAVSMLRVVKQDYDLATKIPAEHVAAWTHVTTLGYEVWVKARQ